MDLVERLKHFERGGTVENPKALLREAITEIEHLRFSYAHSGDHMQDHAFVQGARADNDFCWYQHNPDDRGRGVRCGVHRKFHGTARTGTVARLSERNHNARTR